VAAAGPHRRGRAAGSAWAEKPVVYQGAETFPWPGKKKLKDEPVFITVDPALYDAAAGRGRDRPGPYEARAAGTLSKTTMNEGYTLARS
jgi:hypothetical protein